MCGIWGQVNFLEDAQLPTQTVEHLISLMQHRGPDEGQVKQLPNVSLAHRRLSIIDVGSGQQPMSYGNGRYWIVYNGEIYNHIELRARLTKAGHKFSNQSDTETILAAYAQWGKESPRYLNGIFAFAIWDTIESVLFCARDHLGVKPFFYNFNSANFTFSSELKSLIKTPNVNVAEINHDAVSDYLALGYTLTPRTMIKGVNKLPPGHWLFIKQEEIQIKSYWNLREAVISPSLPATTQTIEEFSHLLEESVNMQLLSDVPLGAFLSGGLDSSTIVAMMSRHISKSLQTFSMGFSENTYSELDYANEVADYYSTNHFAEVLAGEIVLENIEDLIWRCDEPLGDTSLLPTYALSQFASSHVKVVLSGDGADECLAGYDTYVADWLHSYYSQIPKSIQKNVFSRFFNALPASPGKVSLRYRLSEFSKHGHETAQMAHYRWRQLFTDEECESLLGGESARSLIHQTQSDFLQYFEADFSQSSWLKQAMYVDLNTWLLDDILVKVDRASMAASLEARVPFLNHELVTFTMQLPDSLKMRYFSRKRILKQVMENHLPKTILARQKRGFNAPVSIWMRGAMRSEIEGLLNSGSQLVDLDRLQVHSLWKSYLNGDYYQMYKLWALVNLLMWEKYVWRKISNYRLDERA